MSVTLTMMKGLPASGKSTKAIEIVKRSKGKTKRINKDDMRAMVDAGIWLKGNEQAILEARDLLINYWLNQNYNVIVDDTNLHPKHEKHLKEIVDELNSNSQFLIDGGHRNMKLPYEFIIDDSFLKVSVNECIERDVKRENSVGKKVILDMFRNYISEDVLIVKHNPNLPNCIICDVDGTLALKGDRSPYDCSTAEKDKLNGPVAHLLSVMQKSFTAKTFIFTGRENTSYNSITVETITRQWLENNYINYNALYIRPEKDSRNDAIVKKEMYDKHVKGKYNVLYVIDDRPRVVRMWRSLGLTVLDVNRDQYGVDF